MRKGSEWPLVLWGMKTNLVEGISGGSSYMTVLSCFKGLPNMMSMVDSCPYIKNQSQDPLLG